MHKQQTDRLLIDGVTEEDPNIKAITWDELRENHPLTNNNTDIGKIVSNKKIPEYNGF